MVFHICNLRLCGFTLRVGACSSVAGSRHYATSWKVVCLIPDEVSPPIHLILPASLWPWDRLSLLTEMSTRKSSWGVKGDRRVKLTTLPPSVSWLSRENVGASMSHKPVGLHGLPFFFFPLQSSLSYSTVLHVHGFYLLQSLCKLYLYISCI
jgi:hypothetical protein